MILKWFTDSSAKQANMRMAEYINPMCKDLMPDLAMSHFGVMKDPITQEVQIRIHLRPIAEVNEIHDRLNRNIAFLEEK